MAPKKRKIANIKVKKKKWFPIYAPALFNDVLLGESYVTESALLEGKYITANLSTITRNMRKQNVNIQFKVEKVSDGKGYTSMISYSLINAAVKRLVKRGRDKISDSFLAKTKDKKLLRIKPLIISLNPGTKSTQSAVRLETRRVIREFVFSKTLEESFSAIIDGKLQKVIKDSTAKIIPLKSVEIRIAKLEENKNVVLTEDGVRTEKVTIRSRNKGEKHLAEEEESEVDEVHGIDESLDLDDEINSVDDSEDFNEEDDSDDDDELSSIDDDEKDFDEEENDLIEEGEDEANDTTPVENEPETILEEFDDEKIDEESNDESDDEEKEE
jgi:ribosomal protein S3AE